MRKKLARVGLDLDFHLRLFVVFLVDDELNGLGLGLTDFGLNGPERCAWAAGLFGACQARRKEDVRGGHEWRSAAVGVPEDDPSLA